MKSYTDIEQSKKLAEILPVKSADMKFPYFGDGQYGATAVFGEAIEFSGDKDIPCWSLAALLNVLNMPALTQNNDNDWDVVINSPNYPYEYIEIHGSNPVDACVEMILKLYEQKLL